MMGVYRRWRCSQHLALELLCLVLSAESARSLSPLSGAAAIGGRKDPFDLGVGAGRLNGRE